jgi:hypothetical protein
MLRAIKSAAVTLLVVPCLVAAQPVPDKKEPISPEKAAAPEKVDAAPEKMAAPMIIPMVIKPMALPPLAPIPAPVVMQAPPPMIVMPIAVTYVYSATAQAGRPNRLGNVAAGATWSCDERGCKTSAGWDRPAVPGCTALARQIGPIGSYGRDGAALTAEELDSCNRGIPGAVMMAAAPEAPAASEPAPEPAPVVVLEARPPAPATPAASGMLILASELTLSGGRQGTVDRTAGEMTITSGELSISGGAIGRRPAMPAPMTVNVSGMSIIGR